MLLYIMVHMLTLTVYAWVGCKVYSNQNRSHKETESHNNNARCLFPVGASVVTVYWYTDIIGLTLVIMQGEMLIIKVDNSYCQAVTLHYQFFKLKCFAELQQEQSSVFPIRNFYIYCTCVNCGNISQLSDLMMTCI